LMMRCTLEPSTSIAYISPVSGEFLPGTKVIFAPVGDQGESFDGTLVCERRQICGSIAQG
jgi:hypothetical protein